MIRPDSARRGEGACRRRTRRVPRWVVALGVLASAMALSGCGSISEKFRDAGSQMPGIGLPAGAPERTAEPAPFPAVHDVPAPRNSTPLTPVEQDQMERDLISARDVQQTSAGRETQAQVKKKAKPAAPAAAPAAAAPMPSRSGATIY